MSRRALIPAAAVLIALGGCAEPTGSTAGTPANAAAARLELCRTGSLKATIAAEPAEGTEQTGVVTLINDSTEPCAINGWLTITLVNGAHQPVKVPTVRVDEPGPATEFPLAADAVAYAGLKWTTCTRGEEGCGAGNFLRYDVGLSTAGPAAVLEGFPKNKRRNNVVTMSSLEVGSLQPSRTGVTDW
ncbi:DUF4232 domain-containing protein [Actinoplanes sp. NBC_00393]|uniref:DUF4232 domain-containing protein n=1 Tax=Actinoplanes sp. NBC_00393 TaxID=2975953 RepID=UPI002E1D7B10